MIAHKNLRHLKIREKKTKKAIQKEQL